MPKECCLKCPYCGVHFDFTAVTTITPDSDELQQLLAGTLNVAQCPECGAKLNIPTQLVYRDAARPCMIALEPTRPADDQLAALALQMDEGATNAALENGLQRPVVRLVFTHPDFVEKIFLHQAKLDDRVIEFAKYQLFNGGADGEIDPLKHRLLFDIGHSDEEKLVFIVYARKAGRPIRLLQVSRAECELLRKEITDNPQLRQELDHIFPGCLVDVDHIFAELRAHKNDEP